MGSPGHKWKGKLKIQKWLNVSNVKRKNDNKIVLFFQHSTRAASDAVFVLPLTMFSFLSPFFFCYCFVVEFQSMMIG